MIVLFGKITPKQPLILESQMPSGGAIFSDGIASDFLEFNASSTATISIASSAQGLWWGNPM